MSILIDESTTFIIQGITGREAFCPRRLKSAASSAYWEAADFQSAGVVQ